MTETLSLRPWRAGDEDAFTPRKDFAEERAAVAWAWGRGAPGRTWTLYRTRTGEVLGMGGIVEQDDHFEAWASLADLPRREWPGAVRLAGRALAFVARTYGLCVSASARADNPAARLVLERLGFELAGHREDPRLPDVLFVHMTRRP